MVVKFLDNFCKTQEVDLYFSSPPKFLKFCFDHQLVELAYMAVVFASILCRIGHIYFAAQEKDLPLNMLCGSRTYHGARVFVENQIKVLQQSNLRQTM